MNKEETFIKALHGILPKSPNQRNKVFQSDAEIIDVSAGTMLFSMDEFSSEDFFRDDAPFELGRNLAIATISDLLASGGDPRYFAHSLSFNFEEWNQDYVQVFAEGIASVLKSLNMGFIGGDLGRSDTWKYTGVAFGDAEKPMMRTGACKDDFIYLSGKVGAGNVEAAMGLFLNFDFLGNKIDLPRLRLNLRYQESRVIRKYANCCIDTSDGVLRGLNILADQNLLGYHIDNIPYQTEGQKLCQIIDKPPIVLLMGECGEYELLFTVSEKNNDKFLSEANAKDLHFNQIGQMKSADVKTVKDDDGDVSFNSFNISARSYPNIKDYLNELLSYVQANRK